MRGWATSYDNHSGNPTQYQDRQHRRHRLSTFTSTTAAAAAAPLTLEWLDVEIGDMLSSVSVGVASPSYVDAEDGTLAGLFPLLGRG